MTGTNGVHFYEVAKTNLPGHLSFFPLSTGYLSYSLAKGDGAIYPCEAFFSTDLLAHNKCT
jgi:hypothetical protein